MCVGPPVSCNALRGQKSVSDLLELELQAILSCHVDAGDWTWVICKSRQCPWPGTPGPIIYFQIINFSRKVCPGDQLSSLLCSFLYLMSQCLCSVLATLLSILLLSKNPSSNSLSCVPQPTLTIRQHAYLCCSPMTTGPASECLPIPACSPWATVPVHLLAPGVYVWELRQVSLWLLLAGSVSVGFSLTLSLHSTGG